MVTTSTDKMRVYAVSLGITIAWGLALFETAYSVYAIIVVALAIMFLIRGCFPIRLGVIDLMLALFCAYRIVSSFFSPCPKQASCEAFGAIAVCLVYFSLRFILVDKLVRRLFCMLANCVSVAALILAIVTFVIFHTHVVGVGFEDSYLLRFLYKPLGYLNNVWAEIALLLLGFSYHSVRLRGLLIVLSTICVLLTFSRGGYAALALFYILSILVLRKRKQRMLHASYALLSILFVMVPYHREVSHVISVKDSYSTAESTNWRLTTTRDNLKDMGGHLVFGNGTGSYTLVCDSFNMERAVSFAPNIFVKMLAEGGLVAISLFLMLVVSTLTFTWKNRHKVPLLMPVVACLSVLVKENTLSVMFETLFVGIAIVSLLALVQASEDNLVFSCVYRSDRLLLVFVACSLVAVCGVGSLKGLLPDEKWMVSLSTKNRLADKYKHEFANVVCKNPHDLNLRVVLSIVYERDNDPGKALAMLESVYSVSPNNPIVNFKMGRLLTRKGNQDKGKRLMSEAILQYPRLLLTSEWKEIDSSLKIAIDSIMQKTFLELSKRELAPAEKARMAYIYYHEFGLPNKATLLWRSAVKEYPSLSVPWLFLGDTEKYELLTYGIAGRTKPSASHGICEISVDDIFWNSYRPKFETWY